MSNFINEKTVMEFYLKQLDENNITFLKNTPDKKDRIYCLVSKLLNAENMNSKIEVACDLWKALFEASLSYISDNRYGYDKMFKYFDAYVEFEELIFASDSFYRDHTLHCIWVYFLGEYIKLDPQFAPLFLDMKQSDIIVNSIYDLVKDSEHLSKRAHATLKNLIELLEKQDKYSDAADCLAALTHDLGYPLKKIEKINKSMKKVLPYFSVNDFKDFSFNYNNLQQESISNFIDLLSRSIHVNLFSLSEQDDNFDSEKIREIHEKIFETVGSSITGLKPNAKDIITDEELKLLCSIYSPRLRFPSDLTAKNIFLNEFENYQHGIMSAYLLFKNLGAFQEMVYNMHDDDFSNGDTTAYAKFLTIYGIMGSISIHTVECFSMSQLEATSYLTFIDELEEFSRISRASQNREYVKEFCESSIEMDENGWLNIDFLFNNNSLDNLDPERAFKGRCNRFLTLFEVKNLSPNLKIRLSCIGQLENDKNTYTLEIANHHAVITINGEQQNIPKYLKSSHFFTTEEYKKLD